VDCADWPIRWPCNIESDEEATLDAARLSAQQILWSLSGRRYGTCEVTEQYRPPCDQCLPPYADNFGPGVEYALGRERRNCCGIVLDSQPVRSVSAVEINGVALDPSEYVLERSTLKRLGECWPCGDGCDLPPVSVTYEWGLDVPPLGELAMGELACEILAAIRGADCRLPSNAVSVTRQGVSVDLGDAQTLYDMGRLGLQLCDAFLRAVNPNRLASRSVVYSPDFARRAR